MIFTAAFIALPFVASVFAKDCTRKYTVQAGDICDSISAAKNVSTYQLSVVNPGINEDCTNLTPGSELCLGYKGEDCTSTYVVVAGNTCDGIAATHNMNTTILYSNNPQIDDECSNIYVGEVLCVGGQVAVPPTPSGPLPGATIPTTAAPANPSATKHTQGNGGNNGNNNNNNNNNNDDDEDDEDDEDLPFCDEI